CGCDLFRSRK
ncbi:Penicillin-binding protein activator LpoA precursor, partial [Haemophilus influenzae]